MGFVATHRTKWTAAEAVDFVLAEAEDESKSWQNQCLRLCARSYGYAGSGTEDLDHDGDPEAIEYWLAAKASYKHEGDRRPPVGALACWQSPAKAKGMKAGHIAVVVRSNGTDVQIASNDIVGLDGHVDVVPLGRIEEKWGHTYLGWVEPDFPNGGGKNPAGKRKPTKPMKVPARQVSLAAMIKAAKNHAKADGVLLVQQALKAEYPTFDFSSGPGFFGPLTVKAYSQWQRDQPERFTGDDANGIPGMLTLKRLGARHGFAAVT
jgi:hypothetical protein